ncbi:GntR family transcriptional regulator [Shewanella sp. 1_MG-2023]|uniref:GntR family transcriptional regulator n=1 Tax=Shewanella electrodiphila TaxID=934143 RepID=A0ABT0KVE6_9GAMM|nr:MULTISPECIES: GntR family transcriptional regulator [Shewanella]MCL1047811.1 GntR family transcriptional regulator [Shewanella electrodiphila]MDO6613653.1 GntR family transcriptional regulator [Shewanella sp. 7_MG-2023]MDO6773491.1 GntR family transcriptional regulator [Shewanella sp. 2_MG-2023]MDO6796387.1 GntR family transcriptional regulator [Shewanella sp. 1_MG-2023]
MNLDEKLTLTGFKNLAHLADVIEAPKLNLEEYKIEHPKLFNALIDGVASQVRLNKMLNQHFQFRIVFEYLNEHYKSGQNLPSENDLALEIGSVKSVIREQLARLESLGYIDIIEHGKRNVWRSNLSFDS